MKQAWSRVQAGRVQAVGYRRCTASEQQGLEAQKGQQQQQEVGELGTPWRLLRRR